MIDIVNTFLLKILEVDIDTYTFKEGYQDNPKRSTKDFDNNPCICKF